MKPAPFHGLLVIDKPSGITSRDAVDRAQRWFPRGTRVGHTGTLDPLATGVLVMCVGAATRLTEYVQHMPKTYRTTVLLGARSDTDDADGTITPTLGAVPPTLERVRMCLREFVGKLEQVPPAFSAAHVGGQRAYSLARRGEEVALSARTVHVHAIDVLGYSYPRLELEVRCGKGTYIRSLARDLGERLGCGGLVEVLRRTRVGHFTPERGVSLDTDPVTARAKLLPIGEAVAELPAVKLDEAKVSRLRHGQTVPVNPATVRNLDLSKPAELAVFDGASCLVAVATFDPVRRILRPAKVIPQSG